MRIGMIAILLTLLSVGANGQETLHLGDLGKTWVEIDGQVYGARPCELGPIGGGEGYHDIYTTGDITVTNLDEFRAALQQAEAGQVIWVPDGVEIDLTDQPAVSIPGGVTLAGGRGNNGSPGALLKRMGSGWMLTTGGDHVRVTGLRFEGAYEGNERVAISSYFMSIGHYGGEVDNCEIYNFNTSGIAVGRSAMGAYIHHNYMHHIWQAGLGYAVTTNDSDVRIMFNRFDCGRHHAKSAGWPGAGYEFAHNWVGPNAISTHVDMHGGRDRGDGTDIAGDWIYVHHNTFMGRKRPVGIRGVPSQGGWIHNNWFHDFEEPSGAVVAPWPVGGDTRMHMHNNAYGPDRPVILDVEFEAHRDAFDAAMAAYRQHNSRQARAWFARAGELASSDAERALAMLHEGHCYMSMGVDHAAWAAYEEVLAIAGASERLRAIARNRLERIELMQARRPQREWALAFTDDFARDELGDDWKPLVGNWRIENSTLRVGEGHSEIIINHAFAGTQRLELEIMTPSLRPCDFSPAIHSTLLEAAGRLRDSGYWLQFGGAGNTLNRILRDGVELESYSVDRFIERGRLHHLVAEFDGQMVRLRVDGVAIMEAADATPLLGSERTTIGLVTYDVAHVKSVRVYTGHLE